MHAENTMVAPKKSNNRLKTTAEKTAETLCLFSEYSAILRVAVVLKP